MPRDLPIGNGSLLVTFDRDYQVRDIYYPNLGRENHSDGRPFRVGVWCEGRFSWLGPEWEISRRYREELKERALPMLEWVADHAMPSGVLAEQVNPYTNDPVSVSPLTWSHATAVVAVLDYLDKLRELTEAART